MATTYTLNGATLTPGRPFVENGIAYPANWLALATDDDLTAHGITKTEVADPAPTADQVKASLVSAVWRKQVALFTAGVTVNGLIVSTTERGCVDLAGAVQLAERNPQQTFDFAGDMGKTSIDATTLLALAVTVGNWVQATYTAAGTLNAGIQAGTVTTVDQINDPTAWPSPALTT